MKHPLRSAFRNTMDHCISLAYGLVDNHEKVSSSKPNSRLECKDYRLFVIKMTKINIRFLNKTARKQRPRGERSTTAAKRQTPNKRKTRVIERLSKLKNSGLIFSHVERKENIFQFQTNAPIQNYSCQNRKNTYSSVISALTEITYKVRLHIFQQTLKGLQYYQFFSKLSLLSSSLSLQHFKFYCIISNRHL